jgi:hypothetical protein
MLGKVCSAQAKQATGRIMCMPSRDLDAAAVQELFSRPLQGLLTKKVCACREAQEEGEYAEAFWLCAQCIKSMDELGDELHVAAQVGGRHFTVFSTRATCTDRRPWKAGWHCEHAGLLPPQAMPRCTAARACSCSFDDPFHCTAQGGHRMFV